VISDGELAAIVAALQTLQAAPYIAHDEPPSSRWKRAAREPELELEDLRVH
jgi:Acyl-CoA carboxylase epsilon subunit